MTARHQFRVGTRLANRDRAPIDATPAPSVGDALLAARERKGVDLYRAERDTKIRARFLDALERDDYAQLPGSVYTKGFLRNYAVYLGLDPDEMVEHWRRESLGLRRAPEKAEVAAPPRPLQAPRTGLTFTRGLFVAALLTLVLVGFVGYVAVQLLRFAQPPELVLTEPTVVSEATTETVTMRGTSAPAAAVSVVGAGNEEYLTTANEDGTWNVDVRVIPGRNEFTISSVDPATAKESNDISVIVNVPLEGAGASSAPSSGSSPAGPVAAELTVSSPTEGQVVEGGVVAISGTSTGDRVTVSAVSASQNASPDPSAGSPEPSGSSSPSGPTRPAPLELPVADGGTFSGSYSLPPGSWTLSIVAEGEGLTSATETRAVLAQLDGLHLSLEIRNRAAWVRVLVDGQPAPGYGGGRTLRPGATAEFTAQESIVVRTGSSGATFFTFNGVDLGALGASGIPETWVFDTEGHRRAE